MQTPSYADIGLATELKNWLVWKAEERGYRNGTTRIPDRIHHMKFLQQTRHYLTVLMKNRMALYGGGS